MNGFYNEFKRPIVIAIIFFLGLFLYTHLVGPISFSVNNVNTNKADFFTAQGKGEVSAVPDSATAYLGVTATGTTVAEAQNKTNELSTKVINSIMSQGISEKDIKTTNYSINPNYGSGEPVPMMYPVRGGGNNITGYTVSQNLEIKISPIDKLNKVVDAATTAGANEVQGANFTFSDSLLKKLQNEARQEAVSDAKDKANSLAQASGIHLGRIVNVVESDQGVFMPMAAGVAEKSDQSNPTNITPGQNTVTINVTIYYDTF